MMIDILKLQSYEDECQASLPKIIEQYPDNVTVYLSVVQAISSLRNLKDNLATAQGMVEYPTIPFRM